MTIKLKLDKEDAEVLEQVLEAYLSELRFEISNTDSFDYAPACMSRRTG
jgi:hypothetical protein